MSWVTQPNKGSVSPGGVRWVLSFFCLFVVVRSQCPWPREVRDLNGSCLCAYNLQNQLSIQCSAVNFTLLMTVLHQRSPGVPLDLLYVNNTRISVLNDRSFDGLDVENIQFSSCGIYNISEGAFRGLEDKLVNLNLQDNRLAEVPTPALARLRNLKLLDLSGNLIKGVPDRAFRGLGLNTLKLADNELSLSHGAFAGLERTLKNLNLKGTEQKEMPRALLDLPVLAFLDVAQNQIRSLKPGAMQNLHSLTALNLERNLLQSLEEEDFLGVNDTLSSLSLLNNLITLFPTRALNLLSELRVLDVGFNLLSAIPDNGFTGVRSLTLLALDGNPLTTVPERAFTHLNTTLRGLSVGGRFLHCDCRVGWISRWISDYDLQVTSRERNPQFCGQPPEYRERSFYQLGVDDFTCDESVDPLLVPSITSTSRPTIPPPPRRPGLVEDRPVRGEGGSTRYSSALPGTTTEKSTTVTTTTTTTPATTEATTTTTIATSRATASSEPEVIVQDAYRKDNSVIIQWDSEVSNILGFRVVYRLFGDKTFKLGPPLAASEREFKIKNVPTQECIVVCVVSLEDASVTPESVQYSQCREIRTETSAAMHMDTIIIAASAAICGTVIIAVIVFICCNRKRSDITREKHGIPAVLSPSTAPLASLGTLGSGLSGPTTKADWDTLSMYSQRSIPRARMYHMDKGSVNNGYVPDDARSHISHISSKHIPRPRSMADGQSQRSYSALSAAQLRHAPSFNTGLGLSRQDGRLHVLTEYGETVSSNSANSPQPSHSSSSSTWRDLSLSRQSLAASHMSGFGPMAVNPNAFGLSAGIHHQRPPSTTTMLSRGTSQRSDRNRRHSRSKSRERASSRLSHAGSTHSLTGYDTDGWTDHDMDIYVARNPTHRGLVQL